MNFNEKASKDLPQQVTCDVFDIEFDNENCHSSHLVKKSKIQDTRYNLIGVGLEPAPLTEMTTLDMRWVAIATP